MEKGLLNVPLRETGKNNLSAGQRFAVVIETATMSERELAEYCRQKGLFVDDVKQWRIISIQAHETKPTEGHYKINKELQEERRKIKALEKELARKEKALAETAALLVLREKFNALWESKGED
ncbi:conserved hypothetical protein [Xenorhabdus innexi]|uniref:Transcriptional regulator n=1 Tax=Xenorhabdus innexi TaxID=290109 RepID=A0A1N6N0Q6_9GAMM|nr:transcriptional regulator [Xenorhabdus innexi]SIP74619.1 conserved hypothetical protein [Xenorhabdus innexi]